MAWYEGRLKVCCDCNRFSFQPFTFQFHHPSTLSFPRVYEIMENHRNFYFSAFSFHLKKFFLVQEIPIDRRLQVKRIRIPALFTLSPVAQSSRVLSQQKKMFASIMLANLRLGTFSQLTMHNFSIHRVFLLFFLFPHTLRESSRNIFPCKAHEKGEKTRLANNKNGN